MRRAPVVKPIFADDDGVVSSIATRQLGLAVIELGGGRRVASDKIDHAVGLDHLLGKNFLCDMNTPLAMIHAADEPSFERAAKIVKAAYTIGGKAKELPPVLEKITA